MKMLVIGLEGATAELLFDLPGLTNLRRLMDVGCYGRLESVVPPTPVPAWMCMSTSQDPGTVGVYGVRNRTGFSYDPLDRVTSQAVREVTIWDQVTRAQKRANVIGVPPNYPARRMNGVSVGCFLTPDVNAPDFTWPQHFAREIVQRGGAYSVDVEGHRTLPQASLRDQVYAMTAAHFELVRHLMKSSEWDYFQILEIGLDRIQRGFWKHFDTNHRHHVPESEFADVIPDYYQYLDEQIGGLLELLDDESTVVVLSSHGAQRLEGVFCLNEWLVREGDLVLHHYPEKATPFAELDVDWRRTRAWSAGGDCAQVFLNVKGREREGSIDPADFERVRDDLKARLEALTDEHGHSLGNMVFRPDEIFREVNGVAPDLLVQLGGLRWQASGRVGYSDLYQQGNGTDCDDCNPAQYGAFILASPDCPHAGELENVHLLDIAPTLLELGDYDIPPSMQGRSVLSGDIGTDAALALSASDEELIRQRLSGLGYI